MCCLFYLTEDVGLSRSEAAALPVSPALWAAQQQLLELRQQRREVPVVENENGRSLETTQESSGETQKPWAAPRGETTQKIIAKLPDHLGWESVRITAACRSKSSHNAETLDSSWWQTLAAEQVETASVSSPTSHQSLKLYPSLALAMLRQGHVAAGRIWLLLRHLDEKGQGWIDLEQARQQLSNKGAPLRLCGWRQLRNLLAQGEGIFWQRDKERLWLRSTSKVAATLHVKRFGGKAVTLPITILTEKIGVVRAHFYASFHSGRDGARPIARQTLQQLGGICPHTQRDYEKRAHVKTQPNFAIGTRTTSAQAEEMAWQHGGACFQLTDYQGQQGKPGRSYLAWQLPNSYTGPHSKQASGGQKRFNRELADLWPQGTTGNDHSGKKRYYSDGQLAAKAFNRGQEGIYWQGHQRCWYWLGGGE